MIKVHGGPGNMPQTAYVVEGANTIDEARDAIAAYIVRLYGTSSFVHEDNRPRLVHDRKQYELWAIKTSLGKYNYLWFDITEPVKNNEMADTKPHRSPSGSFKLAVPKKE